MTPSIVFDEYSHTYRNTTSNQKYISATTLVGKYKQPFDGPNIAKAYAEKHGGTAQHWLDVWEKNKNEAATRGTKFHQRKENHLLAALGLTPKVDEDPHPVVQQSLRDYKKLENRVYPELMVYDHYWNTAGMVDLPIFDGEFFDVKDYKTSKAIYKTSFFDRKLGAYKRMKFPLNHLMDCNFEHYQLQLSFYAYMIERLTGKKCRNLVILHHASNPDGSVEEEAIEYPCQYVKEDVELMLQHYFGKPLPENDHS